MNTTPVPRPTRDTGPEQWTIEDVRLARAQGRDLDIEAARQAGQLANLMAAGEPGKTYDHSGGGNSRVGGAMTPKMAAEYLRRNGGAA